MATPCEEAPFPTPLEGPTCASKKTYTKKKQKEQKTRNASYTTTTIQNKNCLTRMYPSMAYIVCFKAHEGLKSKFVLTTVIEFKI